MKDVLLYGGGTQSTGLLLMMCDGFLEGYKKPDLVVFSDTGGEPGFVYDYVRKVVSYVDKKYGVTIEIVSRGDLVDDLWHKYRAGNRVASLPLFLNNKDKGMIRRQCTNEYKILPINKLSKKRFNVGRRKKDSVPVIRRLFGISLDEMSRCKQSTEWWCVNDYPLVNNRMYRNEVIEYVNLNHPELADPPRSSCYFCPFHSNLYWKLLQEKHPGVFTDACQIDKIIRKKPGLKSDAYLHRSLKPLGEVDFSNGMEEIFGECDGYCGI